MGRKIKVFLIPWIMLSSICFTAFAEKPTSLRVTRTESWQFTPFSPRTITDSEKVQRLYDAVYKLPHPRPDKIPSNCPSDSGLIHHLEFYRDSVLVKKVDVDFGGCGILHLPENDVRTIVDYVKGHENGDYWWFERLFIETTGISKEELHPLPTTSKYYKPPKNP